MHYIAESANTATILDPLIGAKLIAASGTPRFGVLLLEAARAIANTVELFAYRLPLGCSPVALLSSGELDGAEQRMDLYSRKYHSHDPVLHSPHSVPRGGFVRYVRASEIAQADYRELCFERPGFVDKMCFGWRSASDITVISFYARNGGRSKHPALSVLASIGLSVLRTPRPRVVAEGLVFDIEQRLLDLYPQLSGRERAVCSRTIAGWSARRIAEHLDIRPSTVLTYRQRAYERLGFSKASDFLGKLLC
jgi:DNA-binding CsgD family transcriptional regulator